MLSVNGYTPTDFEGGMATFRDITSKPFLMLSPLSREECVSRLREAIDLPGEGGFWKHKRFRGIVDDYGLRIELNIPGSAYQSPLNGAFVEYNGKTLIKCNSLVNIMSIIWFYCLAFIPLIAISCSEGYNHISYNSFLLFSGIFILVFAILAPLAYVFGALTQQRRLTDFLGTTVQARKVQRHDLGALDAGAHGLISPT